MPSSLRLVLLLLVLGAFATPVAVYEIYHQDDVQARITAQQITGGHVRTGKALVGQYGCASCHQFAESSGTQGMVGPSLKGVAVRATIAGRLANQPDNMILWLRHPQQVVPGNGMPDQGLSEQQARDLAAYLYTLKP